MKKRSYQTVKFLAIILAFTPLSAQTLVLLESDQQDIIDALEASTMISNVTLPCVENASGMVTFEDFDFGGDAILLTTGTAENAIGPNDQSGASTANESQFTDPGLAEISGVDVNDVCGLEFNITPNAPWLSFTYIFGSEEYPEFVCQFNDAMGIFITGENPGAGDYQNENVIFIPGTNDPVSINTVNDGQCDSDNSFYYSEDAIDMQYDGMTIPMMSTIPVVASQTYHVRISIADALDSAFDSGLIVGMSSFGASFELVNLESINKSDDNTTTEGCEMITIEATVPMAFDKDVVIDYEWQGTAEYGVDFMAPLDQFIIPAGQTTASLMLEAFVDDVEEGSETAIMHLKRYSIGIQEFDLTNELTLNIIDFEDNDLPTIAAIPEMICAGESIPLEVSNASFVSWEPSTHLSADNIPNPTFSVDAAGTYEYIVSMTFSDNCPPVEESLTIVIENCDNSAVASVSMANQISVFPNPLGENDFEISLGELNVEISAIEIFDAQGKLMIKMEELQTKISVSSSNWPQGIYYFNAVLKDGSSVAKKLIK